MSPGAVSRRSLGDQVDGGHPARRGGGTGRGGGDPWKEQEQAGAHPGQSRQDDQGRGDPAGDPEPNHPSQQPDERRHQSRGTHQAAGRVSGRLEGGPVGGPCEQGKGREVVDGDRVPQPQRIVSRPRQGQSGHAQVVIPGRKLDPNPVPTVPPTPRLLLDGDLLALRLDGRRGGLAPLVQPDRAANQEPQGDHEVHHAEGAGAAASPGHDRSPFESGAKSVTAIEERPFRAYNPSSPRQPAVVTPTIST